MGQVAQLAETMAIFTSPKTKTTELTKTLDEAKEAIIIKSLRKI